MEKISKVSVTRVLGGTKEFKGVLGGLGVVRFN
jgi:hypothetical protein